MTTTIPQRALRNDNAKVIEAVIAGESFIVTRNGLPVAELRPLTEQRSPVVSKEALLRLVGVGPSLDAARFRADLDQVVDPAP